jgi:dienelactone hydrolase
VPAAPPPKPPPPKPTPPFAFRVRSFHFVDRSRGRTIVTEVRLPPRRAGPFPLVVFGHGFALEPSDYSRLLDAWARAGYVVAAPVFPFENANAPGGPNENDLVNQPADVSFVISRLLAKSASGTGPLSGLVSPRRVAAGGHSDGGATAVAVGYESGFRDRRLRAVVTFAGAGLAGGAPQTSGAPALLAVQGTADQVHPAQLTYDFFASAGRPKYLLRLIGADHESPYTQQSQLRVVKRVTIEFLDRYLKGSSKRVRTPAGSGGAVELIARP